MTSGRTAIFSFPGSSSGAYFSSLIPPPPHLRSALLLDPLSLLSRSPQGNDQTAPDKGIFVVDTDRTAAVIEAASANASRRTSSCCNDEGNWSVHSGNAVAHAMAAALRTEAQAREGLLRLGSSKSTPNLKDGDGGGRGGGEGGGKWGEEDEQQRQGRRSLDLAPLSEPHQTAPQGNHHYSLLHRSSVAPLAPDAAAAPTEGEEEPAAAQQRMEEDSAHDAVWAAQAADAAAAAAHARAGALAASLAGGLEASSSQATTVAGDPSSSSAAVNVPESMPVPVPATKDVPRSATGQRDIIGDDPRLSTAASVTGVLFSESPAESPSPGLFVGGSALRPAVLIASPTGSFEGSVRVRGGMNGHSRLTESWQQQTVSGLRTHTPRSARITR